MYDRIEWNGMVCRPMMELDGIEWDVCWNGMEWNGMTMEWNGMEWSRMEWNRIELATCNLYFFGSLQLPYQAVGCSQSGCSRWYLCSRARQSLDFIVCFYLMSSRPMVLSIILEKLQTTSARFIFCDCLPVIRQLPQLFCGCTVWCHLLQRRNFSFLRYCCFVAVGWNIWNLELQGFCQTTTI